MTDKETWGNTFHTNGFKMTLSPSDELVADLRARLNRRRIIRKWVPIILAGLLLCVAGAGGMALLALAAR